MGRKKGKGKSSDEKWDEGDEGATAGLGEMSAADAGGENPVISGRGAGKKGKSRKKNFEDLDAEMEALAAEMGVDVDGTSKEVSEDTHGDKLSSQTNASEVGKDSDVVEVKKENKSDGANKTPPTASGGGGKKSKKKRKKGDIDDEELESMLRDIEGEETVNGTTQSPPVVSAKQASAEKESEGTSAVAGVGQGEEEEEGETGESTVMTAAQKKAAKKEREKKKKEAARQARIAQQGKQEKVANVGQDGMTTTNSSTNVDRDTGGDKVENTVQVESKVKDANVEGEREEVDGAEGEGGEDAQTEDKKKKKKKKKKEEEKPKGKTPGKAAISKIKKLKAALEEEQRRREEEALAAQREEEERERKRLEQLQLEKERKERLKQKEKERKARRKLEGKPVTKKEKEAEQRRQAHLEALRQQGISVPEKRQGSVDEQGKKKVVYGARQRKYKKKQETSDDTSISGHSVGSGEIQEDESSSSKQHEEEDVPDRWDDEEEEPEEEEKEHIKANWDDESEEENENVAAKPAEPDKPVTKSVEYEVGGDHSEEEGSSSGSSDESEEEEESESEEELSPFDKVKRRIEKRRERYEAERSEDTLRSPVVCVLGHVDTGKTKILDKIRRTNVQDGEAGGITQQIGATFVPQEAIREQTKMVKEFTRTEIKVPGLLIIDTPGHESFSNLRSRGSSMCDIAILVVDIMHGLEPQTLESLNILRKGKTPFIVALNKIDRMYDWQRNPSGSVRDTLKRQKPNTKSEFEERAKQTIAEFAEQGLNAALFWEKVDFAEYIPMVPTSAITGDGMGDLIALLVSFSLKMLTKQLMLSMELEALVLEVKVISGLGTTIDVILRNGVLREGDTLVLTGTEGPFATTVRALLMPQPLRELRVKNAYVQHKAVLAAQGVKVTSKGELEKTLAGTSVLVAKKADEVEVLKAEAAEIMKSALSSIKLQERGVYVQASTLGSLEALLEFLKQSKIPYCGVSIGPVHKKDVMKASVMLEHDSQWAVILAFDVRVERDAQEMADSLGVKIFSADIIYHLFDAFLKHRQELMERKRREFEHIAVFPCKLRIMPNCIFNTRDPIVVGVVVEAGIIKPGTPLTVPSKSFTDIGVVSSIEVNHKTVELARKGEEVCIKVESTGGDAPRLYGRHFDHTDPLVSKISRESIDAVKNYFRDDLQKSDWQLMIELKKTFQII